MQQSQCTQDLCTPSSDDFNHYIRRLCHSSSQGSAIEQIGDYMDRIWLLTSPSISKAEYRLIFNSLHDLKLLHNSFLLLGITFIKANNSPAYFSEWSSLDSSIHINASTSENLTLIPLILTLCRNMFIIIDTVLIIFDHQLHHSLLRVLDFLFFFRLRFSAFARRSLFWPGSRTHHILRR